MPPLVEVLWQKIYYLKTYCNDTGVTSDITEQEMKTNDFSALDCSRQKTESVMTFGAIRPYDTVVNSSTDSYLFFLSLMFHWSTS